MNCNKCWLTAEYKTLCKNKTRYLLKVNVLRKSLGAFNLFWNLMCLNKLFTVNEWHINYKWLCKWMIIFSQNFFIIVINFGIIQNEFVTINSSINVQ